jgi:hypothetical protein
MKSFFESLLASLEAKSGWKSVAESFLRFLDMPRTILFHPYATEDTNSIGYFNRDWIPYLSDPGPDLIIRRNHVSEYSVGKIRYTHYEEKYPITDHYILAHASTYRKDDPQRRYFIYLTKFGLPDRDLWVLEVNDYFSEDLLILLINNDIRVPYIYSDLYSLPYPLFLGDPWLIPPHFYTCMYKLLGVKAHICDAFHDENIQMMKTDYNFEEDRKKSIQWLCSKLHDRNKINTILEKLGDKYELPSGYRRIMLNDEGRTEFLGYKKFEPIPMLLKE